MGFSLILFRLISVSLHTPPTHTEAPPPRGLVGGFPFRFWIIALNPVRPRGRFDVFTFCRPGWRPSFLFIARPIPRSRT